MGGENVRRGFAPPMTLLFIVLLSAGFITTVTRINGQVRELDSYRIETEAFALAQGGLEQYLAGVNPIVEDTTMRLDGGTARVYATLIRPRLHNGDSALYVVRADGVVDGRAAKREEGRRAVSQLAYRIDDERGPSRWSVIANAWIDQR